MQRNTLVKLFTSPIQSPQQWGLMILIALMLVFSPEPAYNDWQLNTDGLYDGLQIYANNPDYVYPPWALILLWPYRFLTAAGSRVASGLVVGWLAQRRGWSLLAFFAVVCNPFFIFMLHFSNVDILAMIFPLLLWETTTGKRWETLARGLAMAIFAIKPQGSLLIVLYLLWQERHQWRKLWQPVAITALLLLPISLLGNPMLFQQWLHNVTHPSAKVQEFWANNNISLATYSGFAVAFIGMAATLAFAYWLLHRMNKQWRINHTYAVLFTFAMLLSPYISNQSFVVPTTLLPSWTATLIQWGASFANEIFTPNNDLNPWLKFVFVILAMWFYRPRIRPTLDNRTKTATITPPTDSNKEKYPT